MYRYKLIIYIKGGNSFVIKCNDYKVDGFDITTTKLKNNYLYDINEVQAVLVKKGFWL